MPNIKSAQKRMELSARAREKNRAARSRLRTAIKKVRNADSADAGSAALQEAIPLLDRASRTRLIHPNKAARLKGNLQRRVNALAG